MTTRTYLSVSRSQLLLLLRSRYWSLLRFRPLEVPLLLLSVLAFAVVLVKTAWLSEDAFITFRTIDNFIHGYGLTWNAGERVQAYTHPLWLFLLTIACWSTGEIVHTSMLLSMTVSLITIMLFVLGVARPAAAATLSVIVLISSKAFMDYSTSGLENPLTHLLLVSFFLVYLNRKASIRTLFILSLVAAMGTLNRMDALILFLPPLMHVFIQLRSGSRRILAGFMGFLPFILWESFALFYYGFPFPNTAYAKLNTGVATFELVSQGFYYLLNSLAFDPITVLVVSLGVIVPFFTRDRNDWFVMAAILLHLLYVVRIGGDFMSGRFLTAPFLVAVILLSRLDFARSKSPLITGFLVVVTVGSLLSANPPLLSNARYGTEAKHLTLYRGIADERAFYYQATGLLNGRRHKHGWQVEGEAARLSGTTIVEKRGVGIFGYYAGPQVHIVDLLALAEPLLARLPVEESGKWRVGHFQRTVPEGYLETLRSSQNKIQDQNLALYYDKLSLVTKGNLFSTERLVEIWNLNVGKYDYLLEAYLEEGRSRKS